LQFYLKFIKNLNALSSAPCDFFIIDFLMAREGDNFRRAGLVSLLPGLTAISLAFPA
jgi:hypothetical protein